MTNKERILKIFKREKVDRPPMQLDLFPWYNRAKQMGKFPEKYKNSSYIEVCDDLNVVTKGYEVFNPAIKVLEGENVSVTREEKGNLIYTYYETPKGKLREISRVAKIELQNSFYHEYRRVEYPLKNLNDDFKVMEYILKESRIEFDWDVYRKGIQLLGDRVEPMLYIPRIPFQRLIINYMGFENTIYALHDFPEKTERLMRIIERTDDKLYKVLEECPIKIINFGDNIDANMSPPPLFEKYILPYYKKRTTQLKKSGKFTHAHWDGNTRSLLRFAKETGLDGIEAITPLPQGDVTLEEVKEALGDDIIYLDGIPAILFLDNVNYERLENFTKKILSLFKNNIILGISDELPQNGDIEKVRFVSEIVNNYKVGKNEPY